MSSTVQISLNTERERQIKTICESTPKYSKMLIGEAAKAILFDKLDDLTRGR